MDLIKSLFVFQRVCEQQSNHLKLENIQLQSVLFIDIFDDSFGMLFHRIFQVKRAKF